MTLAHVDPQGIVTYPINLPRWRNENKVSIRDNPDPAVAAEHGLFAVTATDQPEFDPATQYLADPTAELVEGEWREVWAIIDLPPEEIAQSLKAKRATMAVDMRQARLALLEAGLLSKVEDAIAAIPNAKAKAAAKIDWEYATEVRRRSPLIKALAPALGLSGEQLDALFDAAALIE